MREFLELRVKEKEAHRVFRPDEGTLLSGGDIRKVLLPFDDARVPHLGELNRDLRDKGGPLFFGWDILRRYSAKELRVAELFHLSSQAVFEPAGETCGTRYDESAACFRCGAGAQQTSELILDVRRIPKGADLARTIADELVISTRLAEAMQARGFTGAQFRPVRQRGKKGSISTAWHQLVVASAPVEVVTPTLTGDNPFDLDPRNERRCPLGHVAGLNLLSELYVSRGGYDGSDLTCTRQMFGNRSGVLRPRPFLLMSPRLRALLVELRVKRLKVEVAHLV